MSNLTDGDRVLPLCYRCNHKVTSHAVDDERRAECMECSCPEWENSPDGKPIYPASLDVIDAAADRYDPGHLLRVNAELRAEAREQEAAKEAAYQKIYRLAECNESMREPVARLRDFLEMPAEGEGAVINTAAQSLLAGRDEILRLNDVVEEYDALRETIAESLPRYVLDDGSGDDADETETIEYAGREIQRLTARHAELRTVLGTLLNLFDPPGEAKRRHHAEDENGFWMAVSGTVNIGRQIIPKPPACRMCRGGGADEYGAECSDCDGEGYDAKAPITDAERRVWEAIARNVAERAKED